jgi:hypothetical protein
MRKSRMIEQNLKLSKALLQRVLENLFCDSTIAKRVTVKVKNDSLVSPHPNL